MPADPLEAYNLLLQSMFSVKSPCHSNGVPTLAKPVRGDLSESDLDEDWAHTRVVFHDTIT